MMVYRLKYEGVVAVFEYRRTLYIVCHNDSLRGSRDKNPKQRYKPCVAGGQAAKTDILTKGGQVPETLVA